MKDIFNKVLIENMLRNRYLNAEAHIEPILEQVNEIIQESPDLDKMFYASLRNIVSTLKQRID